MKKAFIVSLILVSIFSTLSLSSFALSPYDSIPYVDGSQVMQYNSSTDIRDIGASDGNTIVINKSGTLEEYDTTNMTFLRTGKVFGLENIDHTGSSSPFGVIGSDNQTKRIYFDCMNKDNYYIPYPTGISTIYAINGKVKWELGSSGQYEATLYIDINRNAKFYGYFINEYKLNNADNSLSSVRAYSTKYYERGDFAYAGASKIVGVTGNYWPIFFTKTEIDSGWTNEKGIPAGYNCHGFVEEGSNNVVVINPSKLTYGSGYYYAIIHTSFATDIVRLPESTLVF